MRGLIIFLAGASLLASCDSVTVGGAVEVRIENASSLVFASVSYWAGGAQVTHGRLAPGEATPYVNAEDAYGYTTVEVVVEGDTVRLQVIDFVGETPLSSGRYTYVTGVEGSAGNRSLSQSLRKDP